MVYMPVLHCASTASGCRLEARGKEMVEMLVAGSRPVKWRQRPRYSVRSTCMGCTDAARRAGR